MATNIDEVRELVKNIVKSTVKKPGKVKVTSAEERSGVISIEVHHSDRKSLTTKGGNSRLTVIDAINTITKALGGKHRARYLIELL